MLKLISISGAGGFIGSKAVGCFLNKGYKIRAMDNFYKGHCDSLFHYIDNPNFEFFEGDVTNPKDCTKLVDGSDAVLNLAGLVGFPVSAKNPILAWATNHIGTKNMIEARNNYNKDIPFILTSTGSVYGAVTEEICTEKTKCNTSTVYGLTKLAAENELKNQPNTIIYRYATAFGVSSCPRVKLLVNDFVYRAVHEGIIDIFESHFKRTFIHIKDFVRSLEFAIENYQNMPEQIFNCGDNALNKTKLEIAEIISQRTGCIINKAEIGKDLDVRNYEVSVDLLNNKGFKCEVSIEEGIDELIKAAKLLRVGNRYEPN